MINETLEQRVQKLHLQEIKRHIFLCCDQTNPKCCDQASGLAAWEFLKKRLEELHLTGLGGIYRTKANCLRVCQQGPIAVVYPEGVWYHSVYRRCWSGLFKNICWWKRGKNMYFVTRAAHDHHANLPTHFTSLHATILR